MTHKKAIGHWVSECIAVSVRLIDCTAILCTFVELQSELGRIPWSDGMFKVQ